jgi:signal transduction histidine kinase
MKWNKIVLKLGGTIMILFLVVLLPLGFVINQIFSNFYFSKVQEETEQLSEKYASTIPSLENPMMLHMFETLADLTNKETVIIDDKMQVVANSGVQGVNLSKDEIDQLLAGQPFTKRFEDTETKRNYLVSGHPIIQSGNFKGAFFVLASVGGINESIAKVRDLLILSGVGAFFLALGFTFVVSRKMSDPLIAMEKATRQMTKGDLDIRLNVPSGDEIGSLAKAINDLAYELNRYRTNQREFFADISHELRTPISYLHGYAQVLRTGLYQTEEEKSQYLKIIEDEANRLIQLINDLFDLSKMEEGRIDLHIDSVNVGEIAENALSKIKMEAENKGLSTNIQIQENLPLIEADGLRMEQIFINLLNNAVRYTEKGSINVEVDFDHNNVKIVIADTGIGIPERELSHIFERFHRVEKSRSRDFGGTGLGLAIVKNLVEIQNGSISVNSQVGKGTKFEISFPVEGGTHEKN